MTATQMNPNQMAVLLRRLQDDPKAFQAMFVAEGLGQLHAAFAAKDIPEPMMRALWNQLLREDEVGVVMMRFIWDLPLAKKRVFIKALEHLGDRYPMFKGLYQEWPAGNWIPPYVRPAEIRKHDFDLVTEGYLGYLSQGYSQREVDLFVWLEAVRDKHCADRPCQLGELLAGAKSPQGGCPVQIKIPEMMELLATGRFLDALKLVESTNPLPNVTGRVCPQELQCQGVCVHKARPMEIGQLEWYVAQREMVTDPEGSVARYAGRPDPWQVAAKPPVAVVGSGPAGLINAFMLANEGFPVTVFEAFHTLGGVLKYGIPEFRLPNKLVDDVVDKIKVLGGRFVTNFVVGKTATLDDLKAAGFWRVFVGTGAGLPRFMNVPGEHLNGVMSANEFLTRVNLMGGAKPGYDTPLPETNGKEVLIIGGGNTAMDAARTAKRLGGNVTIVYRRTKAEMPSRVEELEHALEEGIVVAELQSPCEFLGNDHSQVVAALIEVMRLGEPDDSGRRRPVATGEQKRVPADLVIMALGNSSNPIIRDSQPDLEVHEWGAIKVGQNGAGKVSQATNLEGIYSGGDAARGGSTAIKAAGDGLSAAEQMLQDAEQLCAEEVRNRVKTASDYTAQAAAPFTILSKRYVNERTVEMDIYAPMVARSTQAGQFLRLLTAEKGELLPLTVADYDVEAGTITIVTQTLGASTRKLNDMEVGQALLGVAGPLGLPSKLHKYDSAQETVVFVAGGVGIAPAYSILRANLELGNHVTVIQGARNRDILFWTTPELDSAERVDLLKQRFGDQFDVVLCSDDGSFGYHGFVTGALEDMLRDGRADGRRVVEITTIGPPLMMRAVSDVSKKYEVPTVASLNSIMVDATGMCGACMVPIVDPETGGIIRKHACIDGPELDAHSIDWDKFLPRFSQFKSQEQKALEENSGV